MPEIGDRLGWLGTGAEGRRRGRAPPGQRCASGRLEPLPEKTAPLPGRGAKVAGSIAELAATSDIVFTMVTGSGQMLEVVAGLLQADTRPAVIVDCSTTSEEASAQARGACTDHGVAFLAAPVSGDPTMVRNGAAAIVCSGPEDAFARVQPALDRVVPIVVCAGLTQPGRRRRDGPGRSLVRAGAPLPPHGPTLRASEGPTNATRPTPTNHPVAPTGPGASG